MTVEVIRLTPAMVSRKNQVLAFIQSYYSAHGGGPSISEMANAIGCSRGRVQDALRKLERDGKIIRVAGKVRGITPISSHDEAIRQLVAQGYSIDQDGMVLIPPTAPLIDLDDEGRLAIR